jgi:hypothetical protein
MPASPRLLYRRIAHALQNARRVKRRVEAADRAAERRPAETPPLVKVPAR